MKNLFGGMTGKAEGFLRTRGKKIDEEVEGKKKEPKKEQRPPQSKKWAEK